MLVVPLPSEVQYVTLSYVWGSTVDGEVEQSGLPAQLSQTVKDTIVVVHNLGLRYLWVDRYCIPQHDPTARQQQIGRMADIYSASTLTIIAADGQDANHGLTGVSKPRSEPLHIRIGTSCLVSHLCIRDELQDSKWNTRGWTYQEGMLAQRRLVFAQSKVVFQCQTLCRFEDLSQTSNEPQHSHEIVRPPFSSLKTTGDEAQ